jgi:electron transfer flavoprotein alpha subunit
VSVLVVIDHDRGEAAPASWNAATAARHLAERLGVSLHALVVGVGHDQLIDETAVYGATTIRLATGELLADYGPETWGAVVAEAAADAAVVVAPGTERGNEVLAHAAAVLDAPMVANVTQVVAAPSSAEPWIVHRVRWGGSLLEEAHVDSEQKLLTIAPTAFEATPQPVDAVTDVFAPSVDSQLARSVIVDRVVLTEGITLATAPVVVGGGRGVGSAEGYEALEELADLLGGVVGCSRVATNNGWRPHSDQVGQTGTKIAPRLYIACGISGAIQHWVGAMGSKHVLAINTDPEANMVTKADHAVIGDLHEVVPAITAEIRRRRS